MIKRTPKLNQRGMILVSVFIVMGVLLIIGISLVSYTLSQFSVANRKVYSANALMVAEAGIEQSMDQLNQNDDFSGYASEQELFNDPNQGRGTFAVTIQDAAESDTKIMIATGKVYKYGQSANPVSTRKVKVTAVGTTSTGYSVHTGPGGLILGGSANITNSNVFVNGKITMSGSAHIGTYAQPLTVNVANVACPSGSNPGPTYPEVCSTGQPISLSHSTFIYGTVCATGQTSYGPNPAKNIQTGSTGEGLKLGCVADPVSQPTYDRAAHIAAVTTTAAGTSNTYTCANGKPPTTRSWPAHLKLTGDTSVDGGCNITINGDTYITGDLDFGGSARFRVADSVGSNRPTIIVDGDISVGGSAQLIANNVGTGINFISFHSNAACNPNCTNLTGNDLKNSQNLQTILIGSSANLPGMTFQAYWSKITILGSSSVGGAAGQTVDMNGSGTVTFGTILASGERSWTITSYQQQFD